MHLVGLALGIQHNDNASVFQGNQIGAYPRVRRMGQVYVYAGMPRKYHTPVIMYLRVIARLAFVQLQNNVLKGVI